ARAGIELAAGRAHRIEAIEPAENGFARALKCLRVLCPSEPPPNRRSPPLNCCNGASRAHYDMREISRESPRRFQRSPTSASSPSPGLPLLIQQVLSAPCPRTR